MSVLREIDHGFDDVCGWLRAAFDWLTETGAGMIISIALVAFVCYGLAFLWLVEHGR